MSDQASHAGLPEGEALFNAGEYAECVTMCAEAIDEYSWQESWRQLRIRTEMQLGRYADALSSTHSAIESFPDSIQLRLMGHEACLFTGRDEEAARLLDEIEDLMQRQHWRYYNAADQIALGQFFLLRGADAREVLETFYDKVKASRPTYTPTYLVTGQLALSKYDFAVAAEAFREAARRTPEDPAVHYGLARAYASGDTEAAQASLAKALELNPSHSDSLLLVADRLIDQEHYDQAKEVLSQVLKVNPRHPEACAHLAVLSHLEGDSDGERQWRTRALYGWKKNPAVDHLMGTKLSQKYRFAEGAAHQRQSLEFEPDYLPAKIQLSQDLLRLGHDAEGWQLAQDVYLRDGYNVVAHNLVTLQETIDQFKTLEADGLLLRMEAREADIYGHAALELLREAKRVLSAKYDVELDEPVVIEIFPEQKDFAIRTFGLPGGEGFLGVCFGHVITANSPASQGNRPSNWKSVLWHEFCHVITLHKTKNKMPRWLSEGISVYEERQADPAWGQSMTALYRQMIFSGQLTPVSRLSGAFLQPASPMHLQFAYYESALVVEYLIDEYGHEALLHVLDDLAQDVPINAALETHVGSLEVLDNDFARFARDRAESLAGGADWTPVELPLDVEIEILIGWNQGHPNSISGLRMLAKRLIDEGRWVEAKPVLTELIALYPEDASSENAYRLLVRVHRELGDSLAEQAVLETLARYDAESADVFVRLMELHEATEDWAGVARSAERMLAVNPLLRLPHRQLALAAEKLNAPEQAIGSYRALLRMDPIDPAEAHFRLASLLEQTGDIQSARRHVLMALEEAPRYRDAGRLLLDLVEREGAALPASEPPSPATPEASR